MSSNSFSYKKYKAIREAIKAKPKPKPKRNRISRSVELDGREVRIEKCREGWVISGAVSANITRYKSFKAAHVVRQVDKLADGTRVRVNNAYSNPLSSSRNRKKLVSSILKLD